MAAGPQTFLVYIDFHVENSNSGINAAFERGMFPQLTQRRLVLGSQWPFQNS